MQAAMDKDRQEMQETEGDRETRSAGDFDGAEHSLTRHIGLSFELFSEILDLIGRLLGSRWNIPIVDRVSSVLGTSNPLAKGVDPATEAVWLFDNTAYRPVHIYPHAPQPYQAQFIAAYFKKKTGRDVSKAVADIASKIGLGENGEDKAAVEKKIANRLLPFMETIAPARSVEVKFPKGDVKTLGPGDQSGLSDQTIVELEEHPDGETATIPAVPADCCPHGSMLTHFAGPEGWLFISDIDDSIKITMTPSPFGILRSTFVDSPTPISGMPDLYAHINTLLAPTWFYLSASPYNLYPFLRTFLHTYYPQGTTILRDASWMDLAGFLASYTKGTEEYKSDRMVKIHEWLPQRKVLCLGDSTQSDPEAYGDIYRKYEGWVKAIFIRKVTDVAEMKNTDKNTDARFENAFRDVPSEIWRTFEDPKELYEAVEQLKGT